MGASHANAAAANISPCYTVLRIGLASDWPGATLRPKRGKSSHAHLPPDPVGRVAANDGYSNCCSTHSPQLAINPPYVHAQAPRCGSISTLSPRGRFWLRSHVLSFLPLDSLDFAECAQNLHPYTYVRRNIESLGAKVQAGWHNAHARMRSPRLIGCASAVKLFALRATYNVEHFI